ncbi:MAG: hypothetical protein JWN71_3058 [Xanthobacteraceae bacterium]|nr:hypothetical protein [Xanthobacteraceae bacterium]
MALRSVSSNSVRGAARAEPRLDWYALIRAWLLVAAVAVGLTIALSAGARAQIPASAVKGEATVNTKGGYARLVFHLAEDVESTVRTSGSIIVITFKRPVDVAVERLNTVAPGYISAARRDPDGTGIRLALAQKVTVNTIAAGERLFVDLLPESWAGLPPGLPAEVVEELARRAREAERKNRQQELLARQRKQVPIRVRVASQPTFTRYVFELPGLTGVSADRNKDKLSLLFDAVMKFDLADAQAALPPSVATISSETEQETTVVKFGFIGKVDVRTFREDSNYVVDVGTPDGQEVKSETSVRPEDIAMLARRTPTPPTVAAPATVPAKVEAAKPAAPAAAAVAAAPAAAPQAAVPSVAAPPAATSPAATPPAAEPAKQPAAPAATAMPSAGQTGLVVETGRHGDNLRVTFPFRTPTPMAVFRRSDTLWLVFDTPERIDLAALQAEQSRTVRAAEVTELPGAKVVRLKLERPRLASLTAEGASWLVTIGDSVAEPPKPLAVSRNLNGARANLSISFDEPQKMHRVTDPDIGDTLLVVTALGPPRGFLKPQDFVELRALASTHGVAIQPLADDLTMELAPDKIILGRPNGLSLSSIGVGGRRNNSFRPLMFDPQIWGTDRTALFPEQQAKLAAAAAQAPENKRAVARIDLAKFYLARDMYPEAKGVLNVVIGDTSPNAAEDVSALVLRGVASILMDRPEEGLKDLSNPLIGNQYDAPLWRAFAYARQGRWSEARDTFKGVEASMGALPVELQRKALIEALRASIEVRDFAGAGRRLNEFELVGTPRELEPAVAVLTGRVAEGLGKTEDALNAFHTAADSWDRRAAAQGQLRELTLRFTNGDIKRPELITDLETLTTVWRGDETEVEALALLAKLYTQDGSYRNAFNVMRTALMAHPNSDMTRRIHDEAALTFDSLFLAGKGDSMPAIDALALFYDFRELTPIGRRGDEMIRRLSDRLVSVDLLDQASELLQHQVDHRLQGAARAQVATRLAVIYLMNRKPDKALSTLRATRSADLSNELRNQRLLIEARALSDVGRHDVAIEVIANMQGSEAVRLRSDVYWSARRWREAAEQIELMLGERWREFPPLAETERADILRAAIGYALGEDALGLTRFREKYAAKMMESPDRRSFEIVTAPLGTGGGDFRDVARAIAAVNTLDGFLREMRTRYPATGTAGSTPTPPAVPGALPPGARAADPTKAG